MGSTAACSRRPALPVLRHAQLSTVHWTAVHMSSICCRLTRCAFGRTISQEIGTMPICRKQQTVTNMNGSRTEAVKWKNGRRSCQATLGQIAETFWNILHEGNVPFLFCGKYYLPGGETVQKIFGLILFAVSSPTTKLFAFTQRAHGSDSERLHPLIISHY